MRSFERKNLGDSYHGTKIKKVSNFLLNSENTFLTQRRKIIIFKASYNYGRKGASLNKGRQIFFYFQVFVRIDEHCVSDCSGNPFFGREKHWQKKIATESAVFCEGKCGCERHAQKKSLSKKMRRTF